MADINNNRPAHPGEPDRPDSEHGEHEAGFDVEAALSSVVGDIEDLQRRLEPLTGPDNELGKLDDQLTKLADTVTELAEKLAARDRKAASGPGGSVSWLDLPDGADGKPPLDTGSVAGLLAELVVWVERVYLRYADAAKSFPECWLWHPDVVEELTWLRHAWLWAYKVEDAEPRLAWDWHHSYRPAVVRRIKDLAGRCSLDQHTGQRTGTRPGVAPIAAGVGDLGQLADWWATGRHAAPPVPSDEVVTAAREAESARLRDGGRR